MLDDAVWREFEFKGKPGDVRRLRAQGINAFLVGEAFMRAADPGAALRTLFA